MAQQIKALVTKPDILSLFIGTHIVEGENQLLQLYSDLHTWTITCVHTHTLYSIYTYIPVKKILNALGTPYLQLFHMAYYERSVIALQG